MIIKLQEEPEELSFKIKDLTEENSFLKNEIQRYKMMDDLNKGTINESI